MHNAACIDYGSHSFAVIRSTGYMNFEPGSFCRNRYWQPM